MPKVSPEHLEARRRQILEAAFVCLSRKGFHRTTMRDIFEESGLSAGAVYRYFDSKETLFRELVELGEVNTRKMMTGDGVDGPPVEALAAVARRMLTALATPQGLVAAKVDVRLMSEALDVDAIRRAYMRGREGTTWSLIAELVERGQRSGEIDPELDLDATVRVLLSLFVGLEVQRAIEEIDLEREMDVIDALVGGGFARDAGSWRRS